MPESTSKRDSQGNADPPRANQPPPRKQSEPEPDRDVENYRDEYDLGKACPGAVIDQRW
jgi:hypothetical protein